MAENDMAMSNPQETNSSQAPTSLDSISPQVTPDFEIAAEGGNPLVNWKNCKKYPGHKGFIPVKKLTKDHLPQENRNDETIKIIEEYSDRTVRVRVTEFSKVRPRHFIGSEDEYPHSSDEGIKNVVGFGTGFVFPGKIHEGEDCPCKQCEKSGDPMRKFQTMYVLTATHVIYDNVEAKSAVFDVFYDTRYEREASQLYGLKLADGDECDDEDDVVDPDGDGNGDSAARDGDGSNDGAARDGDGNGDSAARDGDGSDDGAAKDGDGNGDSAARDGDGSDDGAAKDGDGNGDSAAKDGDGNDDGAAKDGNGNDDGAAKDGDGNDGGAAKDYDGNENVERVDGARGGRSETDSDKTRNKASYKIYILKRRSRDNDNLSVPSNIDNKDNTNAGGGDGDDGDDDGDGDVSLVRMTNLIKRLVMKGNASFTEEDQGSEEGQNYVVVDYETYIRKIYQFKLSAMASNEESENRAGADGCFGYSERFLLTMLRSMDYLDAMSLGDPFRASYVMLIHISEVKQDYVDAGSGADAADSGLSPNIVFSGRQKVRHAITNTASAVYTGLKSDIKLVHNACDKALCCFKLLESKLHKKCVGDPVRDKIKALIEKLIAIYNFLIGLDYSVKMLSIGDLEIPLDFVRESLELVKQNDAKDEVNTCRDGDNAGACNSGVDGRGGCDDKPCDGTDVDTTGTGDPGGNDEDTNAGHDNDGAATAAGSGGEDIHGDNTAGEGGSDRFEDGKTIDDILTNVLSPYSNAFDAYVKSTFGIFLNLFIPLFWEESFSDFAASESDIVSILGNRITYGISFFESTVTDIIYNAIYRCKLPVKVSDIMGVKLAADSQFFRTRPLDVEGISDKNFRRYGTEQVVVKCVTHNPKVIDRFSEMKLIPPRLPLTFIVSHPHGYFKHIAFGSLKREISGPDNSYFEFPLKKGTRCKLSDKFEEPPIDPAHEEYYSAIRTMERGKVYQLARDIRLAVTSKVFGDDFDKLATTDQGTTWFAFPQETACIIDNEYKSLPLPGIVEYDLTGYKMSHEANFIIPSCSTHDIPACSGSSGAFIHESSNVMHLYTHCGSHPKHKVLGYTCLCPNIDMTDSSKVTLKDIIGVGKALFVGGRYLSIYPGPKADEPSMAETPGS